MEDLHVQKNLVIPAGELTMSVSRSGGPGGQHANKTSTRVTIEWNVADSTAVDDGQRARLLARLDSHLNKDGVLQVHCDESRSQHQNRKIALERLADLVRKGLRKPKPRKKTRPSRGAVERRLKTKAKRSQTKKLRRNPSRDD